jgi:pimeloyl-ACP methyl ester carboxylesterase
MVMGWSFGGLFAAHAIQTLPEYVAAQVGDPAAYNVTAYGLYDEFWRTVSRWSFGGPPVGRYIQHYVFVDPAGDGKPAQGPILLEFVSRNPDAGQFIEEWRAVGTQVEAFAYRRSVHWLNVPAEARISRLRNLYWAKLNLFGPQAVTPAQLHSVGLTVPAQGWWTAKLAGRPGRHTVRACPCRATSAPRLPRRRLRAAERSLLR